MGDRLHCRSGLSGADPNDSLIGDQSRLAPQGCSKHGPKGASVSLSSRLEPGPIGFVLVGLLGDLQGRYSARRFPELGPVSTQTHKLPRVRLLHLQPFLIFPLCHCMGACWRMSAPSDSHRPAQTMVRLTKSATGRGDR